MARTIQERMGPRGPGEQDFDRTFWKEAGHEARFAAAWEMVEEAELFRGKDASQSRLQRLVQQIQRRAG